MDALLVIVIVVIALLLLGVFIKIRKKRSNASGVASSFDNRSSFKRFIDACCNKRA